MITIIILELYDIFYFSLAILFVQMVLQLLSDLITNRYDFWLSDQ